MDEFKSIFTKMLSEVMLYNLGRSILIEIYARVLKLSNVGKLNRT